jgi:hypothetical protein
MSATGNQALVALRLRDVYSPAAQSLKQNLNIPSFESVGVGQSGFVEPVERAGPRDRSVGIGIPTKWIRKSNTGSPVRICPESSRAALCAMRSRGRILKTNKFTGGR